MKKNYSAFSIFLWVLLAAGCADDPLRAVRPVADRLLADTLFETVETEAKPARFPMICPATAEGSYVFGLEVPADALYRLGCTADAAVQIAVDGRPLLSYAGGTRAFPREIAYDTYLFDRYAAVRLVRGLHRVEVESTGTVSLGAVDSLDFPAAGIEYPVFVHGTEARLPVKRGAAFAKHPYAEWHYANGATLLGLLALADATGEERYAAHVRRFCDFTLEQLPRFEEQYGRGLLRTQNYRLFRRGMLDDTTAPALPFVERALREGADEATARLLAAMADYAMHEQPRLPDGTFVRPEPRWTIWCDDLFMSAVFLVRYARLTGETACLEEAVRQAEAYDCYLRDPATGLLHHGWNATHDRPAGLHWGRANGWFAWALPEVLAALPAEHPERARLLEIHRRHLDALVRRQGANGMWHQLLDRPETYEESSSTALFVLALARAVRCGWIDRSYAPAALRGWRALAERITPDGIVEGICRSMSIGADAAAYAGRPTLPNDPRGLGAVFTAAVETAALQRFLKQS